MKIDIKSNILTIREVDSASKEVKAKILPGWKSLLMRIFPGLFKETRKEYGEAELSNRGGNRKHVFIKLDMIDGKLGEIALKALGLPPRLNVLSREQMELAKSTKLSDRIDELNVAFNHFKPGTWKYDSCLPGKQEALAKYHSAMNVPEVKAWYDSDRRGNLSCRAAEAILSANEQITKLLADMKPDVEKVKKAAEEASKPFRKDAIDQLGQVDIQRRKQFNDLKEAFKGDTRFGLPALLKEIEGAWESFEAEMIRLRAHVESGNVDSGVVSKCKELNDRAYKQGNSFLNQLNERNR